MNSRSDGSYGFMRVCRHTCCVPSERLTGSVVSTEPLEGERVAWIGARTYDHAMTFWNT